MLGTLSTTLSTPSSPPGGTGANTGANTGSFDHIPLAFATWYGERYAAARVASLFARMLIPWWEISTPSSAHSSNNSNNSNSSNNSTHSRPSVNGDTNTISNESTDSETQEDVLPNMTSVPDGAFDYYYEANIAGNPR